MTSSPRSPQPVNSKVYWDERFSSNWEALGGREQSRHFMAAVIKFLPAAVYEEIVSRNLSLLDCGCAEGDGTAVLAESFPRSHVAGFDFSSVAIESARAQYPALDFFVASFTELDRMADVLISSNCFEHLEAAVSALAHLASRARRHLVLLLPFLESFPPDPEHVRIVHASTFPERVAGWVLTHRILIPPLPVWSQNQILLIYQPSEVAGEVSGTAPTTEPLVEALVVGLMAKLESLVAAQGRLESMQRQMETSRDDRQAQVEVSWSQQLQELGSWRSALEARFQQQREELDAYCRRVDTAQARIEKSLSALGTLGSETELRRHEVERLGQELRATRSAAAAAEAAARRARQERDLLAAERQQERQELLSRLALYESSLAMRSVHLFWGFLRHLIPEGSLRHRSYRRLRRSLGGLLASRRHLEQVPVTVPAAAANAGEPAVPAAVQPDLEAELLLFERLVHETGAESVAVLFSGTELREDEGQRPTQLALSLARRGIPVVFVYWRWDRDEWRPQDRWSDGIYQLALDIAVGEPDRLAGLARHCRRIALFEFPHPMLFEPLAALNAAGWITAYDVLDDWEEFHRVGQAIWYDEGFERHLITATDAVFAVNDIIAARVKGLGGELVQVVPNGLRAGIEHFVERRSLERGEVTVGYFGYLAGAWFDWELLLGAASHKPGWRFYLIGYGGSPEGVPVPSNVTLLGKKPQRELAGYAANWDVAIVPFKPERLAAAADPIKIYEYLAMGLPVVVTGVYPPEGSEGLVVRAEGLDEFVERIAEASRQDRKEEVEARKAYAALRTWDRRLSTMLETIVGQAQRIAEKQRLFPESS